MTPSTVLVLHSPAARHLAVLERLSDDTRIVAGDRTEAFSADARAQADVVLAAVAMGGLLRELWPDLVRLRWVHSLTAGLEALLFPELIESPVLLTNSRGVFARSLSEFAIAGMLHFSKDLRRMVRQQQEHRWKPFDIGELHGRVLGIVGYGEIGRETAQRAKAFGMKIHVLRRRPELAAADPLVDRAYTPGELLELLGAADYLLVAAPLTPATRGMIGGAELACLKSSAVVLNLGRGPVIVEDALVAALRAGALGGAVLDVFDVEPLPAGHPFYELENVLLSPHSADNTATWMEDAMELFLQNFELYREGRPLKNVADKRSGY